MKIIRGVYNLPATLTPSVVTLGNFDGVHLGHQALISKTVNKAKKLGLSSAVMLFEPQPMEFFAKDEAPSRLNSFAEKYHLIKSLGIDYLIVTPFNHSFAQVTAEEFIQHHLIDKLKVQSILVGDDFCFGHQRQGNSALLAKYSKKGFFEFESMQDFTIDGQRVSSSTIRKALLDSHLQLASDLLGRIYNIEGKVVYGNQIARTMGFPTANIHLNRKKPALHGVYFVKVVKNGSDKLYYGIANIGIRPTINGKTAVLEVHIFDFNKMIYGEHLQIEFIEKIRDEVKFSSLKALQQQIEEDICIAKQIRAKF